MNINKIIKLNKIGLANASVRKSSIIIIRAPSNRERERERERGRERLIDSLIFFYYALISLWQYRK